MNAKAILRRLVRWTYTTLVHPSARNSLRLMLLLTERDRPPELITDFSQPRIMVLAPHIDDEVIGCGGTLVRHLTAGAQVSVVYMTDGRWGDAALYRPDITPEEIQQIQEQLCAVRKQEAQAAADILGIQELHFLDAVDGSLKPDETIVKKLAALLNEFRPDVLYLPFVMDLHEDHWQTNRVLGACLAHLPSGLLDHTLCRGYEIWTPLVANRLVDITNQMDIKSRALQAFTSQLKDNDYLYSVKGLNAYRSVGNLQGNGYAEAFHETPLSAYHELLLKVSG